MKFTQEVKDNWIKALKSGEYVQGVQTLSGIDYFDGEAIRTHCCIGVLACITEGLRVKQPNTNSKERYYSNIIPLIEELPVQ